MVSDNDLSCSAPVNDRISPGNDAWNDQRNGHDRRRIILALSTEEKWRRLDVQKLRSQSDANHRNILS
ncbi:hypothetical protein E4U61_000111 [Claviceps capensis]|nr:hypothetical protein E4U61_000111 [Claviceps capensis]